jgi:hypothetical protein
MRADEAETFSFGGKEMAFGEKNRIMRLLVVAVFGTLPVHSAAAQQGSAGSQSDISLAKKVTAIGSAPTSVQFAPFQSDQLARSLATNQHALMSAPPPDIASAVAKADLPPTSSKRFSLPGVSRTNFLMPTTVQPATWTYFDTPAANFSGLRSDKHPDLEDH